MKIHEFKTEKGEFVVVDLNTREERGIECNPMLKPICKLSQATDDDAKLIVDSQMSGTVLGKLVTDLDNHRIEIYTHDGRDIKFISSVKCLHSLLKSKGIDINNGNWYLFKKI